MTDDGKPLTETQAIQRVIEEGSAADFCDVVDVVKKRFGLRVGLGMVEEVYLAMKKEAADDSTRPHVQPALSPQSGVVNAKTLQFVKEMGGFEEARQAIAELETLMSKLVK